LAQASLPRLRGFTLLELTIVIFIIAVMATMMVLSIGSRPVDDRMQLEARRLKQLLELGEDRAQTSGQQVGVIFGDHDYVFLILDPRRGWLPAPDPTFRERQLAPPMHLTLSVEDHAALPATQSDSSNAMGAGSAHNRRPQVLLMSSGEATPFTLQFEAQGSSSRFILRVDNLGHVLMQRVGLQ
jgi:general secretion pathway protein H